MLKAKKVQEANELHNLIPPDSDAARRASVYLAQFITTAMAILKVPSPAKIKEAHLDMEHEKYINKIRNLVNPVVPDDGPEPAYPFISDHQVLNLMTEWLLLLGAVNTILSAWADVNPVGWVSTGKGDTRGILESIKGARELYKHLVPTTPG